MATQQKAPIHFSEMLRLMDSAYQHRQTVNVRCWRSDGHIVEYRGWYVHHMYWRGGYIQLRNPVSKQIRKVPEIQIFEINGKRVYL